MFSDIFVSFFVVCYTYAPVVAIIVIALAILNGVRLMMVARRARRVQARRAAAKAAKPAFNTFETI